MSQAKALQSMARLLRISEYDAISLVKRDLHHCSSTIFATQLRYLYVSQSCITRFASNRWYYYHIISIWSMPINSARGFV